MSATDPAPRADLPRAEDLALSAPLAVTVRDGVIDCVHRGHVVAVNGDGEVLWSQGAVDVPVFERSTAKPFRAWALLRSGAVDAFGFDEGDVALVAGSHSGNGLHVERARKMLLLLGLSDRAIGCPPRMPLGDDGTEELLRSGQPLTRLHGECSGEHIGALAYCRHRGYSLERYWARDHPLQHELAERAATLYSAADAAPAIAVTSDRCLMPTAARPLVAIARRFALLVRAAGNDPSAARLWGAITRNPRVFTGAHRFVGDLIEGSDGRIVGKCGAEGLYVVAWPDDAVCVAVKVEDGNHRGAPPAVRQVAEALGLLYPRLCDHTGSQAFAETRGVVDAR